MLDEHDLQHLIRRDFLRARGKVVRAREVGVAGANNLATLYLDATDDSPVPVLVLDRGEDMPGTAWYIDGVVDTFYYATSDHEPEPGLRIWWVPGPTYHHDGRVEYPEWWAQLEGDLA